MFCGMNMFNDVFNELEGDIVFGELVFKFYDIYGFLVDLINDVVCEYDYKIDEEGFEVVM